MIPRWLHAWREHRRLSRKASPIAPDRNVALLAALPRAFLDVFDDVNREGARRSTGAWRLVEAERQYLLDAARWS
jgi:hypothetical protein